VLRRGKISADAAIFFFDTGGWLRLDAGDDSRKLGQLRV
jgi:hypothetical protein